MLTRRQPAERSMATLCALLIAIVISCLACPAWAGVDVYVENLTLSPTKPKEGDTVEITCGYRFETEPVPPVAEPTGVNIKNLDKYPWQIRISVDNDMVGGPQTAYIPKWTSQSKKGLLSSTSSFWWDDRVYDATVTWQAAASAGPAIVRCELDPLKQLPETNEQNNEKSISVSVTKSQSLPTLRTLPPPESRPVATGAPRISAVTQPAAQATRSGQPALPDPKIKTCKGSVEATVSLDPAQFANEAEPPKHSTAKMNLYLTTSQLLGNYIHCQYASNAKDVQMTYTYDCANAQKWGTTAHTYRCE